MFFPVEMKRDTGDQHLGQLDACRRQELGGTDIREAHAHDGEQYAGGQKAQQTRGQIVPVSYADGAHVGADHVGGQDAQQPDDQHEEEVAAAPQLSEHGGLRPAAEDILHRLTAQLPSQPVGEADHHRRSREVHRDGRGEGKQDAAGRVQQAAVQEDAQALDGEQRQQERGGQRRVPGRVGEDALQREILSVQQAQHNDEEPHRAQQTPRQPQLPLLRRRLTRHGHGRPPLGRRTAQHG